MTEASRPELELVVAEQETTLDLLRAIQDRVGNRPPGSDGQRYDAFTARDGSGYRQWIGLHQIPAESSRNGEIACIHKTPLTTKVEESHRYFYFFPSESGVRMQEHLSAISTDLHLDNLESDPDASSDERIRAGAEHLMGIRDKTVNEEHAMGFGDVTEAQAQDLLLMIRNSRPYSIHSFPLMRKLFGLSD